MPLPPEGPLGRWGERLAEEWLEKQGLRICDRRVRTPYGEIDLIAREGDTLVFVEVKTRRGDRGVSLWELMRMAQRKRIERAARYYLSRGRASARRYRWDLVLVVRPSQGPPVIRWIRSAWSEGDPS